MIFLKNLLEKANRLCCKKWRYSINNYFFFFSFLFYYQSFFYEDCTKDKIYYHCNYGYGPVIVHLIQLRCLIQKKMELNIGLQEILGEKCGDWMDILKWFADQIFVELLLMQFQFIMLMDKLIILYISFIMVIQLIEIKMYLIGYWKFWKYQYQFTSNVEIYLFNYILIQILNS